MQSTGKPTPGQLKVTRLGGLDPLTLPLTLGRTRGSLQRVGVTRAARRPTLRRDLDARRLERQVHQIGVRRGHAGHMCRSRRHTPEGSVISGD